MRWKGSFPLMQATGDGRMIVSLTIDRLPMVLMALVDGPRSGHEGAERVGSLDRVTCRGSIGRGDLRWECAGEVVTGHDLTVRTWWAGPDLDVDNVVFEHDGSVRMTGALRAVTLLPANAWLLQPPVEFTDP